MRVPLPELIDWMTITMLKIEKIGGSNFWKEYSILNRGLLEYEKEGIIIDDDWIIELYESNKDIWNLESDIRKGKENKLGMAEVGKRALLIRDCNKQRIEIRNKIAKETGSGFQTIKKDHISE